MIKINGRVELALPNEFLAICAENFVEPEEVLRGFIADLAEIQNWADDPRDDGYCSNGSDERSMAEDYFNRVGYPMFAEQNRTTCVDEIFEKFIAELRTELVDGLDYVQGDLDFMVEESIERTAPTIYKHHPDIYGLAELVADKVRATEEFKQIPKE